MSTYEPDPAPRAVEATHTPSQLSTGGAAQPPAPPLPEPRAPWSQPPPPPAWSNPAPTPSVPVAPRPWVPVVPLPPRQADTHAAVLGVLIAAIVLIAGGGGFYVGWHGRTSSSLASTGIDVTGSRPADGTDPGSGAGSSGPDTSGSTASTSPDVGSAPSTPTVDPEAAAVQQLDAMRSDSLARLPLDSRWVAQVASKSVGITDPLQTAANGSHTFAASDILAESREARTTVADPDSTVYVVWGTDFGKRSRAPDGSPYWITLVDAGFSSSRAVTSWCRTTYSSLTPAQLADTCAPRQLTPPHS